MTEEVEGAGYAEISQNIDKPRVVDATKTLIGALGEDPAREGLIGTPRRVANAASELFQGYSMHPSNILGVEFSETTDMVAAKGIRFYSTCEHHFMTFFGQVDIGMIPRTSVVGLSKLDRLVLCYSRRLQLQERMTREIADALDKYLHPQGAIVVVRARHLCKEMRGIRSPGIVATMGKRGSFKNSDELTQDFFRLVGRYF